MTAVMVTADDFGLCPEIDEAICLLHDRGIVRRTSLLVNTPFFEASVESLRRRPGLDVAIHLNLTDGRPVLPIAEVPTLVDGSGSFIGGRHYGLIAAILAGRVSRREIHREWRAQIAKATNAGLTLGELNAHGHLHLLPPLHGIVVDLQREFGIPQIRLVRSWEWPRGVLLHLCSIGLRRRLRGLGLSAAWPDRTLGLRKPGEVDPRIRLDDLAKARGGTIELLVHPAARANPYHERWDYRGEEVLNWLLASSGWR